MNNQQNCPICTTELHSINTRCIGSTFICRECASYLDPLIEAIGNGLCKRMETAIESMSKSDFIRYEINDNFAPLIDNAPELLAILEATR